MFFTINTIFSQQEPIFRSKFHKYSYRTKVLLYDIKKTIIEAIRHILYLDRKERKILYLAGIKGKPKDYSKYPFRTSETTYDEIPEETASTIISKLHAEAEKERLQHEKEIEDYKDLAATLPENLVIIPKPIIEKIQEEISNPKMYNEKQESK